MVNYKKILENSGVAFAVLKVHHNDSGFPEEFICVESSNSFCAITGIDSQLTGNPVSEIDPFKDRSWQALFSKIRNDWHLNEWSVTTSIDGDNHKLKGEKQDQDVIIVTINTSCTDDNENENDFLKKTFSGSFEISTLLNSIDDLVIIHDLNNKIKWANRAALKNIGVTLDEIQNLSCNGIIKDYETVCEDCPVTKTIETGKPSHLTKKLSDEKVWDIRSFPVFDKEGKIYNVLETITDISRQQIMEKELTDNQAKFRKYVENSPLGFFIADQKGFYVDVNPSATKITGYSRDELLNKNLLDLYDEKNALKAKKVFQDVLKKGTGNTEITFRNKSGKKKTWTVNAVMMDDGKVLGITNDVSIFKKTREELNWKIRQTTCLEKIHKDTINNLGNADLCKNVCKYLYQTLGNKKDKGVVIEIQDSKYSVGARVDQFKNKTSIDIGFEKTRFGKLILGRVSTNPLPHREKQLVRLITQIIGQQVEKENVRKQLVESELRVRKKLNSILQPELDLSSLELKDIVDVTSIQEIMDEFFAITNIGIGIIDLKGKLLVAKGWQRICTDFHRRNPVTCKNCIESDTILTQNVGKGTFKLYKCKNNMWDISTPIMIGDTHMGNLFLGQFLFKDEEPNRELFEKQAEKYGFDKKEYLDALDQIPRFSRKVVKHVMSFYTKMAHQIALLSYSNLNLARLVEENKRKESELARSEEKFRQIAENVSDIVWRVDLEMNLIYVSPSVKKQLEYSPEEYLGLPVEKRHPYHEVIKIKNRLAYELQQILMGKGQKYEPLYIELEHIGKDGRLILMGVNLNFVFDSRGEISGIQGVSRNIEMIKKSQILEKEVLAANQSAKFKQNFLANMSHEIRTPLTGIIGMTEILQDSPLNKDQKEYLNIIRQSGENLREIINHILDFSKIESGKIKLKSRIFNTHILIQKSRDLFKSICNKPITFTTYLDDQIPARIIGDEGRIMQILNNYISNAVKFTETGTVDLSIYLEKTDKSGKKVLIRAMVKDSGKGVPEEKETLLFTPFSQLENSDQRIYEGTGLGLSISKQLAQMHHGETGFENNKDEGGATFWFTFEAEIAQDQTKAEMTSEAGKFAGNENESLNILLVEDQSVNQKVISLMLKSLGHKVTIAGNGEVAIFKLEENNDFDLVLMDIQMPVMDGITATNYIKKHVYPAPPIVGLSANALEGDRERYMDLGMDEYLSKPIKKEDFIRLLSKLPA